MEMISLTEAIKFITGMKKNYYYHCGSETILLHHALGRELAVPVTAQKISPEYDIAAMDGYAINVDHSYPLRISHSVYAGDKIGASLQYGCAAAVATGAYLPAGANAVLKIEDAIISEDILEGPPISRWDNVLRAGTDYKKGDQVLEDHHRISPQSMALLYGLDVNEVVVYKKPVVGIISTGTEIFNGMVRNTNAVMIGAFLREWGYEYEFVGTVPDDFNLISSLIEEATSRFDVILTTGGVSVGEKDHVHAVIRSLGEMVFHKVRIRPGKPLAVGLVNGTPVFGLPGKPTGAFAALELVVRHFFTPSPRTMIDVTMQQDISIPQDDNSYVLFIKTGSDGPKTMGYEGSGLPLFRAVDPYGTSLISSSPRSAVVDGYVITDHDIKKGDIVKVNLLN